MTPPLTTQHGRFHPPGPAYLSAAARAAAPAPSAIMFSETAKTVQFQLARAVTRKKFDPLRSALDPAAEAWDKLIGDLGKTLA